ncbi:sulfotransferase [Alteromonas mediterranea]|uniref:sulfotransferase n=1 Tax=Alteromonas mediterranea TaxID=314275 RepID=UPI0011320616|nr:sulfotransferase [Alteromonas mediterranea]QDG36248.1 sulfotransferase [Alteromonas mediterranea]
MAKPDFLVIGAQKAGTTWLEYVLKNHRQVWTPPVKELQYFNELYDSKSYGWAQRHRTTHAIKAMRWELEKKSPDLRKIELCLKIAKKITSNNWYENIFEYSPEYKIKGEMTPEYSLISPKNIEKIYTKYPHLKIILVIRDPIERAVSHIKMRIKQTEQLDHPQSEIDIFAKACANDWDVIERGNYQKIIENWGKYFGKNLKIYCSSDFKENPKPSISSICQFLDIDPDGYNVDLEKSIHEGVKISLGTSVLDEIERAQEANKIWFENNAKEYLIS